MRDSAGRFDCLGGHMAGGVRPRRRGLVALAAAAGLLAAGWLAPAPWLAEHWPRVLGVALFLVLFVVPRWFVPARSAASLAGVEDPAARGRLEDERLRLQNDVRVGLLQAVAGVAVIAAVVATWQQLEPTAASCGPSWPRPARSRPPTGSPEPSTSWSPSAWTSGWAASTASSASPPGRRRR
jgi:hypothetical protein